MKSKKKKLLVFASTFPRWKNDTLPPFVYDLSKRLTEDFDVYVLAPHFKGAKKYEVMEGMKVYRFQYFPENYENLVCSGGALPALKKNKFTYLQVPSFFIAEFFALLKLVKKIKPDIIHAHWIPQGFVSALVKKLTKTPYIVTSHGGDAFTYNSGMGLSLKEYALQNARNITVVSNAIKKEFLDKIDPSLNIEVIPMGVDSKLFNPNKYDASIKKKYHINGPFLLFVGRLTEKKGVRYLIEAMPKVLKHYPKTKLMIIGSGELEQELKELANNLNINGEVIFRGAIPNKELPKYYATSDIFISPSIMTEEGDREGYPVTLIEAIASGTKAIITKNKNYLKTPSNLFSKEKNSKDIADKINKFLRSKIKYKQNKLDLDIKKISKRYSDELW